MPPARFLELWRSHNRLNTIAGPGRFEAFYGELSKYLERRGPNEIAVPYRCDAWSARCHD